MPALSMPSDSTADLSSGWQPSPTDTGAPSELAEVGRLESTDKVEGNYNLVSAGWWASWQQYSARDSVKPERQSLHPGPIDNTCLVVPGTENSPLPTLRPELREGVDYVIVGERTWAKLKNRYGGGPAITRSVAYQGASKKPRVMVYDIFTFAIHYNQNSSQIPKICIPREATVTELKKRACEAHDVSEADYNIYSCFNMTRAKRPLDDTPTLLLTDAGLLNNQPIELVRKGSPEASQARDTADAKGDDLAETASDSDLTKTDIIPVANAPSRPITRSTFGPFRNYAGSTSDDTIMQSDTRRPGVSGLSNLGNTCFMNSSLQCLSHTIPLVRCFLTDAYKVDINKTNPLGMKGELAEAFGGLMNNLWKGGVQHVTPRGFKAKIGRFAPQFSGYQQHDSQEFLAFLLDGLHEDINRIKNKPYIEEKDSHGRPDDEVAAEAWRNYRARNDSIIVDHFQGLYKSTLDCPQCSYNSVKFDPFMYLSLPLPESRVRAISLCMVHMDGSGLPTMFSVEVANSATVKELLHAVARVSGVDALIPEQVLVVAKQTRQGWNEELEVYTDLKTRVVEIVPLERYISKEVLLVYCYPSPEVGPNSGLEPVILHHRHRPGGSNYTNRQFFSMPLLMWVPKDQIYEPSQVVEESGSSTYSAKEYRLAPEADAMHWQHLHNHAVVCSDHKSANILLGTHSPSHALGIMPHIHQALRPYQKLGQGATAAEVAVAPGQYPSADLPNGCNVDGSTPPLAAVAAAPQPPLPLPQACNSWSSPEKPNASTADVNGWDLYPAAPPIAPPSPSPTQQELLRPTRAADSSDGEQADIVPVSEDNWLEWMGGQPSTHRLKATTADGFGAALVTQLVAQRAEAGTPDSVSSKPNPASFPDPAQASNRMEDGIQDGDLDSIQRPATPVEADEGDDNKPSSSCTFAKGSFRLQITLDPFGDKQEGTTTTTTTEAGAPEPSAAFHVRLAKDKGDTSFYSMDKNLDLQDNRHFTIDWTDQAVQQYDVELLDHPQQDTSFIAAMQRQKDRNKQPVSLNACVEAFLQPEQLSVDDEWYCPHCKTHVQADKKLDLWSLPEVLVVHLKRFSYTRYNRDKLETHVSFPLEGLDLGRYVLRQQGVAPVYDLFAVSNHFGSLGGGHYTAFAKMPDDNKWYLFDDSSVSSVEASEVQSSAAYVLFYRRQAENRADPPNLVESLLEERRQLQAHSPGDSAQQQQDPNQDLDQDTAADDGGPQPCHREQRGQQGLGGFFATQGHAAGKNGASGRSSSPISRQASGSPPLVMPMDGMEAGGRAVGLRAGNGSNMSSPASASITDLAALAAAAAITTSGGLPSNQRPHRQSGAADDYGNDEAGMYMYENDRPDVERTSNTASIRHDDQWSGRAANAQNNSWPTGRGHAGALIADAAHRFQGQDYDGGFFEDGEDKEGQGDDLDPDSLQTQEDDDVSQLLCDIRRDSDGDDDELMSTTP